MKKNKLKADKAQVKEGVSLVPKHIVNVAPAKAVENEEEVELRKIADSVVIAFFLALVVKIGMWIWSICCPNGDKTEEI